jgi:hypothetical protein
VIVAIIKLSESAGSIHQPDLTENSSEERIGAVTCVFAFQLIHALTCREVDMPDTVVARYRELEPISTERNITPRSFLD